MLFSENLSNSNVLRSLKVLPEKRFKFFDQEHITRVERLNVVESDRSASQNTIAVSTDLWKTIHNLGKRENGCGKI